MHLFDFPTDLSSSFAEEDEELNRMKRKSAEAREARRFTKEIGNVKKAKKKMKVVIDLEEKIEERVRKK